MGNDNGSVVAARAKFAAADLRAARAHGYLLIGQTTKGTLTLRHHEGVYFLTTTGFAMEELARGKPAAVKPVLAALYAVEVA